MNNEPINIISWTSNDKKIYSLTTDFKSNYKSDELFWKKIHAILYAHYAMLPSGHEIYIDI